MWLKGTPLIRHIDEANAVRSFRGWTLHCQGCWSGADHEVHEPLLVSLFAAGSWPPGDLEARDVGANWTMTTTSSYGFNGAFSGLNVVKIPAPQAYNAAGFYGMKLLRELVERLVQHETDPGHVIFGAIRQWGQVVEHDDGYRSEYARVDRLYVPKWLPEQKRTGLSERYGVPTTVRKVAA